MYKYLTMCLLLPNAINAVSFAHKIDPYATHQPVLYEIANSTKGPIIEFGCGNYSTHLLHEICKRDKRLLITIEDDAQWMNKFTEIYLGDGYENDNSGWHKFFLIPGKTDQNYYDANHWIKFLDEFDLLKNTYFDLCFIDQCPFEGRVATMKKMKGKSKYIILHDCNYFPMHNIFGKVIKLAINGDPGEFDFSDIYKYFKVYFPALPWPGEYGPGTLLASDTESYLPDINYDNY